VGGAGGAGGSPDPSLIAHLALWLRADKGVLCTLGGDGLHHVEYWTDQSTHMRDATPVNTHEGPLCNDDGYNAPSGVAVFDFPGGGSSNTYGTLNVDLSFLVGTDYTVFAVESRAASQPNMYLLGALRPDETSCPGNTDQAFHFGYRDSTTSLLTVDHFCIKTDAMVPAFTNLQDEPYVTIAAKFSQTSGHQLYRNGVALTATSGSDPTNTTALTASANGAIGRGYSIAVDTRYQGAVAEIIVYDSALSDTDRQAVETYLRLHWSLP
jgi:hypothetical protein